ncbi:MAG TPA: cobalamin-dependent protein [Gemmatimonadales bacterium]|jgi:DNA-binding transcriptional MerR regulator/methylmalonyl-CoA mutase cobalamin-binding subunit
MAETTQSTTPRHPVRLVATRTGLSPHVLRAWERRYGVVAPTRSEGGQRLYSELDIARLSLLRHLTEQGHAIGQIAALPLDQLQRLEHDAGLATPPSPSVPPGDAESARAAVRDGLAAAKAFDAPELQAVLERSAVTLGIPVFLEEVVVPVVAAIGHGWEKGTVSIAQEHMATAVIRRVLGWLLGVFRLHGAERQAVVSRQLLVATPPTQVHELGALLVGVSAAAEGWTVTYLGPNLPAADLVQAARATRADAVALSIVYHSDARTLLSALREARAGLPEGVPLIVGGAAAGGMRRQAEAAGALVMETLPDFRALLRRLTEETPVR